MKIIIDKREKDHVLGNDHLTWGGGVCFFSKKIFWFPMLLKKYSDFGGGKKK